MRNKLLLWVFRILSKTPLSKEERVLFTGYLLDTIEATPVRDIILENEQGELLVNGRPLSPEELIAYQKMAQGVLDSFLLKTIWDQIRYTCFKRGVSEGNNPDSILFYRVALWFGEQERQWLRLFAGRPDGN